MFVCDECRRAYLAMPEGRICFTYGCKGLVRLDAPPNGHRDGETYRPKFDYERLNKQQKRVYDVMKDGCWHTLRQISDQTGDPEASISARIRDFRKERFGGLTIERAPKETFGGLWAYRIVMEEVETDAGEQSEQSSSIG